jgi:hypothetical protein
LIADVGLQQQGVEMTDSITKVRYLWHGLRKEQAHRYLEVGHGVAAQATNARPKRDVKCLDAT